MRISFYQTVTEALGFAFRRYETVARVGWFPLFLLILIGLAMPFLFLSVINGKLVTLEMITYGDAVAGIAKNAAALKQEFRLTMLGFEVLNYVITTLMYASFIVPLLQLSARGIEPPHHSVVLHIGPRHFKYLLATFATIGCILLLFYLPFLISVKFISNYITEAMEARYASFPDQDSLHTIAIVSGMENPVAWELLMIVIATFFFTLLIYFGFRFLPLPFLAAVREKTDRYNSIRTAWRMTAHWQWAKLALAVIILALLFMLLMLVLNLFVLPLTLQVLNAFFLLAMKSFNLMATLGSDTGWATEFLRWLWVVISFIANMMVMFLLVGLFAGLGGSIVRQSGAID